MTKDEIKYREVVTVSLPCKGYRERPGVESQLNRVTDVVENFKYLLKFIPT